MRIGAALSHEWLSDLIAVDRVVRQLEAAGFDTVTTSGHILTAERGRYPERPDGTYAVPYRDPFVLFTHLSAITERISFRTAILILPLYPTALIARQVADLSEISAGRFELGVGISWQEAEYTALGQDVHLRGRRFEEQIEVLRMLWSEPLVTFHGRFHHFDELGLGRLPTTPIPILIGCTPQERLLQRVGRLGDGWLPQVDPTEHVPTIASAARAAGRDPSALRVVGRLGTGAAAPPDPAVAVAHLRAGGATDITIAPPAESSPNEGLDALLAAKEAISAVAAA